MINRSCAFAIVIALLSVSVSGSEYPMMDMIAQKVIQKYQQSSCEQLWQQRSQPKPANEQEFVQMLQGDPQIRRAFIDEVAAPIANRLFDCGMIP